VHAGTAEPLRVSPPEAVAYPLEYIGEIMGDPALHEASRTVKGRAEQIRAAVEAKARELQIMYYPQSG